MHIKKIFHFFIDTVLPAVCPVCKDASLKYPSPICQKCENKLLLEPIPPKTASQKLSSVISCRFYGDITAECIKQFKYLRQLQFIRVFDKIILDIISKNHSLFNDIDFVIAVPLHKHCREKRGFNQAEIIAESISRALTIPHAKNNLIKIKKTISQNKLTEKQRLNNLKEAFLVTNPRNLYGKSVILVDDVITTGRTLEMCAKELINSGVEKIFGFAIAKTILSFPPFDFAQGAVAKSGLKHVPLSSK